MAAIEDQYRYFIPVVSIAAEFVRYDLSYLPSFGIVCQFLAHLGRRKIIGQAKEVQLAFRRSSLRNISSP